METQDGLFKSPVSGIARRECALLGLEIADGPAPRVGRLIGERVRKALVQLHLQRMIGGTAGIAGQCRLSELRIGHNPVFREQSAVPENSTTATSDNGVVAVEVIEQRSNVAVSQEHAGCRGISQGS